MPAPGYVKPFDKCKDVAKWSKASAAKTALADIAGGDDHTASLLKYMGFKKAGGRAEQSERSKERQSPERVQSRDSPERKAQGGTHGRTMGRGKDRKLESGHRGGRGRAESTNAGTPPTLHG